ncbi:MAG: hypothetical protein NZ899_11410, partial [Thermoguttaceae bacterium]|nr:hypothetical protein [Thermoguttaceae bacterium]
MRYRSKRLLLVLPTAYGPFECAQFLETLAFPGAGNLGIRGRAVGHFLYRQLREHEKLGNQPAHRCDWAIVGLIRPRRQGGEIAPERNGCTAAIIFTCAIGARL